MARFTGYTLDQLLEWCTDDGLIDGFKKNGELVSIMLDGVEKEFDQIAAHTYLRGIFTGVERRSDRPPFSTADSNEA